MNKTAVHAIIMVLTTILAKVLGFCRELSLAFSYGASNVSGVHPAHHSLFRAGYRYADQLYQRLYRPAAEPPR